MTAEQMRTTAEELLGQDRVLEMRMWGPTQELSRNDFEQEEDNSGAPSNDNTTTSVTIELSPSQPTTSAVAMHSRLVYGRSASLMHAS